MPPPQRTFVRSEFSPALPPPLNVAGPFAWVRANLFNSVLSSILTLLSIAFILWITPGLVRWLLIDAVWSAPDGDACRAPGAGACWAYVRAKITFFTYGAYPRDALWRVDLTLVMGAGLAMWLLWPDWPRKGIAAVLFFAIYPVVAFILLHGMGDGSRAVVNAAANAFNSDVLRDVARNSLPIIGTHLWGGIFVSLLVATVGIVVSLPMGVLLALGRQSRAPFIRFFCIVLIEVVRGVPLITVLFMANTMLPLFVPDAWTPDRLMRPLIGVALFASVYMAEVVRGGLQAVPRGQHEGAMALGLSQSKMMRLIVMPQALTIVIPGIVNSFIALFKDTTLVAIVGVFDFLRAIDTQRLDPAWNGPTISTTGYAFAAMFYFVFCFAMSRYSLMMERRLAHGRKR
ncbi:MAG: amino acid ABC transporter permease [Beijerinckiaceae bacterium]|nr:amino acid ABC transporter permease [Beijerinckiaceae bacterium]